MNLVFSFPGHEKLAANIAKKMGYNLGDVIVRNFPDGESYVKINSDVSNQNIILVCNLNNSNSKAMALMFFSSLVRELGAKSLGLIAPYLGYMRQDKRFQEGEAITSNIFAKFLSSQVDWLITIDPHLHRHKSMKEIYTIPCQVLHAIDIITLWIKEHIQSPVLIGPDQESEQWVKGIAQKTNAPYIILKKFRKDDSNVEESIPHIEEFKNHTPILVDDIISTARTMIETVKVLQNAKMKSPVCIGIHAVFVHGAYQDLLKTHVELVATCNTIPHISNKIDITPLLVEALSKSEYS